MTGYRLHEGWGGRHLAAAVRGYLAGAVRGCFAYAPGEDRATGCLYAPADGVPWPGPLASAGPELLGALAATAGTRFTICAFQAYRNGAGCGWHADTPFGAQAILSLGVPRTFGIRGADGTNVAFTVSDGDLMTMPDGFQRDHEHRVVPDGSTGERLALVFRVPAGS